jgi:DNA polymerase-3 subunit epsilon
MLAGPDPATPLHEVTFVVVDLETTGWVPGVSVISEIGAVKLRGGECLGTFQTLVNPGLPIPPSIVYFTGISEAMVAPAPSIESVLPAFLEFVGSDCVMVGHNVRFDLGFLRAAADDLGYPGLDLPFVDTCALARRLVRDEVPNCTLAVLADQFRLSTRPTHRALPDALATGELLHHLLERAGTCGVSTLDDLLVLPAVKGRPQLNKLRLATALPRSPGVYLFRNAAGRVLYVGHAVDLHRSVRSYFADDTRRKTAQLLGETVGIDHIETTGESEAELLAAQLIQEHEPRFNRQPRRRRRQPSANPRRGASAGPTVP